MSAGLELPSGTVTFLFTDIEGSTRLLKQLRDGYARVVAEHQELLRDAFAAHDGQVVDTQGDSFFVAFRRAKDGVDAAVDAQRALASHDWPEGVALRVRMGIHTGQAEATDGRYHGLAVHRASRIGDSGHGGQVLVSQTTRDLLDDEEEEAAGVTLRDLGEQRLKDLDRPVRLYQLEIDGLPSEFPPLRAAPSLPAETGDVTAPGRKHRLRLLVPIAAVVVGGSVAAGVLLTRGNSDTAQPSAGVAADSVGVFDARNGKLITQTPVGVGPSAVAYGEGSVWVANVNDDSVSRVDTKTHESVQTISVGNGPAGLTVGAGFVWVANSLDGSVTKIDPNLNNGQVVDEIPVGSRPSGVAYGAAGVWVANAGDRTVVRIDPEFGRPGRPIPVEAGADEVAIGDGAVWVTSELGGGVSRIDPRTSAVAKWIPVASGTRPIASAPGSVWVANTQAGTVSRIDTATNEVTATVLGAKRPSGVAVADDKVWVSDEASGTLYQIDVATPSHTKEIRTGNRPGALALSDGVLYVAVRTSGLAHVGGTLTTVSGPNTDSKPGNIDPAFEGDWQLLIMTNDGLVTYKRAGAGAGTQVVPDLATSLPTVTDKGKTYTFQLRNDIRYSTGALVQPGDFRRAIERALASGAGAVHFAGIVGAAACSKTRCDLSKGIEADKASNTVSFHLAAADPEFLYRLTLPMADAVPANTPFRARLPLPATGPYMIASFRRGHGIRLVRNPWFHEWSPVAQPNGYPDQIVEKWGYSNAGSVRAVSQGNADFFALPNTMDQAVLSRLRTRFPSRLHRNPALLTGATAMNTRVAPFNDVRVRRAVNYAVDRNRWAGFRGGPEFVQVSCQVLPPNVAGYRRYCPYTTNPNPDGTYTGPDLEKAKKLVAASGTKGQSIALRLVKDGFNPAALNYFVSVLGSLGYRARLDVVDYPLYVRSGDSRLKVQAVGTIVGADFPAASGFISQYLTCASFKPRTGNNGNWAEFCNRGIDRVISRARALQATDPVRAGALWREAEHEIVDQAPWLVTFNDQGHDFVSSRVGNYVYYPMVAGALLDQLWVK